MTDKKEITKAQGMGMQTILIGAIAGAGAGLFIASILHKRAARENRESIITPAEGMQIGLLLFGLFRAVINMNAEEKK